MTTILEEYILNHFIKEYPPTIIEEQVTALLKPYEDILKGCTISWDDINKGYTFVWDYCLVYFGIIYYFCVKMKFKI